MEKKYHTYNSQKKGGVAILISKWTSEQRIFPRIKDVIT